MAMWPWPPVSEVPYPSTTTAQGRWRSSDWRAVGDSTAPPETTLSSSLRSHWSGWRSRASASGTANASPTITSSVTASSATNRHSASGFSAPTGDTTTVPPPSRVASAVQWAVPCVNGDAGKQRVRPARALAATAYGSVGRAPSGWPALSAPKNRSSWRQITPLGRPVVPPV